MRLLMRRATSAGSLNRAAVFHAAQTGAGCGVAAYGNDCGESLQPLLPNATLVAAATLSGLPHWFDVIAITAVLAAIVEIYYYKVGQGS